MPVISITLGKGQVNTAQKQKLIESVTEVAVNTTKIAAPSFIVLISELEGDNIGIGGETLSHRLASKPS